MASDQCWNTEQKADQSDSWLPSKHTFHFFWEQKALRVWLWFGNESLMPNWLSWLLMPQAWKITKKPKDAHKKKNKDGLKTELERSGWNVPREVTEASKHTLKSSLQRSGFLLPWREKQWSLLLNLRTVSSSLEMQATWCRSCALGWLLTQLSRCFCLVRLQAFVFWRPVLLYRSPSLNTVWLEMVCIFRYIESSHEAQHPTISTWIHSQAWVCPKSSQPKPWLPYC